MDIIVQLSKDFSCKPVQVRNTIELFEQGATVPFIARYRKERTGSLDEVVLRNIQHKYEYYKELEERRKAILESIRSQQKLTPELEKKINQTLSRTELEDLYLPYKPKRITRGKKAREAGLEPLARWLQNLKEPVADIEAEAAKYIKAEAGYESRQKALIGACDILADELGDDAEIRKWFRELAAKEGELLSVVRKEFEGKKTKFEMYYNHREKIATIPSHRILAMFRGEQEKVLRLEVVYPIEKAIAYLEKILIKYPQSASAPILRQVINDAIERFLNPATSTEIRNELRLRAEQVAFDVFAKNLRELLLAPPAGHLPVLGIDPGFRTGCKVVVLDSIGKFIEHTVIYPNEPNKDTDTARAVLLVYIQKYKIKLIAVGNGTASRETEAFVREVLKDVPEEFRPICVVVNEAGASVYSASEAAIREFPDFDVTVRGAISIARRLQDPLSELVKIDPKSIGVGQYQHDVDQIKLKKHLDEVVESCVNLVGVDLNLASEELFQYVSGLNKTCAANIVKYRNEHGAFTCREQLLKVPGFGPRTFEQSVGFLRIPGAANPLDNSSVHPERYQLVEIMAKSLGTTVKNLIGNKELLCKIDKKKFVSDDVGLPTIQDILIELEKPGRDPRDSFNYAHFDEKIKKIEDLKEGMILEGAITNVTNFGVFVDIGVHQDGMVHISELANHFVRDPKEVLKVGQVVKVRILSVDKELKRISLSMKFADQVQRESKAIVKQKPMRKTPNIDPIEKLKKWQESIQQPKKKEKLFTVKPKFNIKELLP